MEVALVTHMKNVEGDPWGARGGSTSSPSFVDAESTGKSPQMITPVGVGILITAQQEHKKTDATILAAELTICKDAPTEEAAEISVDTPP